jgi:hypothetical protein
MTVDVRSKSRLQHAGNLFLGPWMGSLEKCTKSAQSAKSARSATPQFADVVDATDCDIRLKNGSVEMI